MLEIVGTAQLTGKELEVAAVSVDGGCGGTGLGVDVLGVVVLS